MNLVGIIRAVSKLSKVTVVGHVGFLCCCAGRGKRGRYDWGVLVLMVAGLLVVVVGDLSAHRPPLHDASIPIYLGDPDDVHMRQSGEPEAWQLGIDEDYCDVLQSNPCSRFILFGFRGISTTVARIDRGERVIIGDWRRDCRGWHKGFGL